MPVMSDLYINVCLRVTGKKLQAKSTNSAIDTYNSHLKNLKIEEERKDGKIFKFWVTGIDEFRHELLSEDVLICSRRVRFEVRDPLPHHMDNRQDFIQARIHKTLMEIKVRSESPHDKEIVAETIGTHISGNTRSGRWPRDPFDQAFL